MTDKIANLPPVSSMMRDCGLEPKKQFGQNFLFDLNKKVFEVKCILLKTTMFTNNLQLHIYANFLYKVTKKIVKIW